MNLAGLPIGAGHPVRIVAEISNAHNGQLHQCLGLIDAAQAAGADIVKFQAYTPEELVALRGDGPAPEPWGSQGYTMASLYEKAQTPLSWFPTLKGHCDRRGMPWFSSVFGAESLAVLEDVGCPTYKISHFEYRNAQLAEAVKATGKPLVVSVPTGQHRGFWTPNTWIVTCPGGYPTEPKDMHLAGPMTGLSSHCRDYLAAPLAVALGAKYLEYHFELLRTPSELEHNVSLNPWEFAAMTEAVRRAEVLCAR